MMCWVIAAVLGLIVLGLLMVVGEWSFLPAIMLAGLAFVLGGLFFSWAFCTGDNIHVDGETGKPSGSGTMAAGAAGAAVTGGAAAAAASSASGAATASGSDGSTAPASLMSGSATTSAPAANAPAAAKKPAAKKPAAKKPAAKAAAKPAAKAAAKPAAKAKAAAKPAAKTAAKPAAKAGAKPAASKAAAKPAAAKATAAKPKQPAVAKDGKPPLLKKARAGGADDLKQIKGVGPGLEKTLNELGFYHFDQVAAWRKKEIEWVDDRLKFKGRIVRDEWTKQAKTLAKGGTTEFSKKVKKGGVY